jgi:hypothetical protein
MSKTKQGSIKYTIEEAKKADRIARHYTGRGGLTSFVKFAIAHLWKDEFNE